MKVILSKVKAGLDSEMTVVSIWRTGVVHVDGVPTRIKLIDTAGQVSVPHHNGISPDLSSSSLANLHPTGGVWSSSLSMPRPRGRLRPLLQPGPPRLLGQRHL